VDNPGDIAQFTAVDQQTDPRFFVRFLDTGSTVEGIQQARRIMLDRLALHEGLQVLDIGCGTGEALQRVAHLVGPRGRVVGVDISSTMIAEATRRHTTAGLPITFVVGDAHHLAFATATFDRCRIERTLLHLDHPEQALAEMVRVIRPGGPVVVFDFDWDMTFIDHPDKRLTRRLVQACSDTIKHGWIGRSLPRLCHAAGLVEVTCVPHAVHIPYAIAHHLFDGLLANFQATGGVSTDELAAWWQSLEQAEAAGHLVLGQLGFVVSGRKR
jgi:ubiquinone/menaquinone biosynthesis C-methylase UbiE